MQTESNCSTDTMHRRHKVSAENAKRKFSISKAKIIRLEKIARVPGDLLCLKSSVELLFVARRGFAALPAQVALLHCVLDLFVVEVESVERAFCNRYHLFASLLAHLVDVLETHSVASCLDVHRVVRETVLCLELLSCG